MTFDAALLAWLAFLSSLGVDMRSHVYPPASAARIAAAEAGIGHAFPEDLRALYRFADGQLSPEETERCHPGAAGAAFFGEYEFFPLADALGSYRAWAEVSAELGASADQGITARAGDPVHAEYWRPGWFPFASDGGGNFYAVDLSPAPGGSYGQVIVIGRDEDERRVLAPSLSAFLAQAAARRPPISDREERWISFKMEEGH
jgi:cell wall assembly regulator SMI1